MLLRDIYVADPSLEGSFWDASERHLSRRSFVGGKLLGCFWETFKSQILRWGEASGMLLRAI
jgi:hypothetical protein